MGVDRIADIIQTGRDHGLPTYTQVTRPRELASVYGEYNLDVVTVQVREYCGLPNISSFRELNNTVDAETISLLETVYSHHEDIDLVVGGLAERPLSGAVVGPTFGCLLGQQFQILKKGDRFWYENNIPPSAFTKGERYYAIVSFGTSIQFYLNRLVAGSSHVLKSHAILKLI